MTQKARRAPDSASPVGPEADPGRTTTAATPAEPSDGSGSAPPRRRDARLVRLVVAVLGLALAVTVAAPEGPVAQTSYLVVVAGAALLAFLGVRRSAYPALAGTIAIGMSVSGFGDLVWQAQSWLRAIPDGSSAADVFWLSAYLGAGAAMLRLPKGGLDRDGMVDVAVIFVVAMVAQWELTIAHVVSDPSISVVDRLIEALYPTFDAALLALVVRAAVSRRLQGRVALLLGGGVLCWVAADFALLVLVDGRREAPGVTMGWMLSCVLLTAAIWVPDGPKPMRTTDPRHGTERARRSRIAIALLPVLFPGAIAMFQDLRGDARNPAMLYAASTVLVGLAYARGSRILQDEAAARLALRAQERFAQAAAMNSSDALALVDEHGIIMNEAPQLAALVGHPGRTTVGRDIFTLIVSEDQPGARAVFQACVARHGRTEETEFRVWQRDGQQMWIAARVANMIDDAFVGGVVINLHDITARRQAEEELSHQAFHDGLTDLANRALFGDRVEHALHRRGRKGLDPVVIYLDLDGFKNVNDSLGHAAGDQLLREVAVRLSGSVRSGDTVARLGGDEFAILIDERDDALAEARLVSERVLRALADPVVLEGRSVTVSASLGIAVADSDATAASLLRDADVAMYRAKTAGRSQWVIYDPEMRSAAVERLQLESDLIDAVDDGRFTLVFQPIIRLDSEQVVGFEALLRWNHPALGVIPPDRFIPVAEETGLIIPIGRWVLQAATATLARWQRDHPGHAALTMAVNLSGRQLASTELVTDVEAALATSGIEPDTLVIEITETALIHDTNVAAERLADLSALGVRLAVDDFGTGYSSLSYLKKFPIDILKIDRSFISTITDNNEFPALVRGLLDLGRTLGLETVAEGVELAWQRDQLRAANCDLAQGYLFSRPLEPAAAERFLRRPAVDPPIAVSGT